MNCYDSYSMDVPARKGCNRDTSASPFGPLVFLLNRRNVSSTVVTTAMDHPVTWGRAVTRSSRHNGRSETCCLSNFPTVSFRKPHLSPTTLESVPKGAAPGGHTGFLTVSRGGRLRHAQAATNRAPAPGCIGPAFGAARQKSGCRLDRLTPSAWKHRKPATALPTCSR